MLPYELWTRVAACLTLDELAQGRLYALNAPFLAYYLRERYRTLRLGSVSGSVLVLSKKLNHIHSLVAENVRTLDVALEHNSFKPGYKRSTSSLVHFIRKHIIFKNRMRNVRKSFPSFSQIHAAFSELKSLTAIRCALYAEDPPFVFDSQRFLTSSMSAAWTASRNTLTSLILTIKVYPLSDLGLDTITFPHLQQFSFILLSKHFSVLVDPLIDSTPREVSNLSAISLAHFLARHQRTLEILTLVFPINAQKFAANLLNQFPILPSLHNLKLHFTPDGIIRNPSLPLGLFNTLQSNSQSLTHLHLIFDNMFGYCNFFRQEDSRNHRDWWTAQSFERIYFPKLQNLRLHFDGILSDTPLMVQLAVSSTATSLDLQSRLKPSYIHQISSLYAKLKGECQLETLYVSIRMLHPSILSSLAHGFPNIKTLKIRYYCIGIQDWYYEPELFMEDISKTTYPNWALENVYLYNPWPYYESPLLKETIAKTLPRLRFITILPAEAYPDD